jgi:hypothetical protein
MSSVSYQTIKLSRGRHVSPRYGACVMELASMIAGEPFSDHPASVCPVIGSFLRAYNDSVDNHRRQDLYEYAAKVVGSAGPAAVQHARSERLASWTLQMREQRWTRSLLPARLRAMRVEPEPPMDLMGLHAVRSISRQTDETHAAVCSLIDELLAIGTRDETGPPSTAGELARPGAGRAVPTVGLTARRHRLG